MDYRFCPSCGGQIDYRIPEQDDRPRAVCLACNRVHYQNPHIVVGVVAFWQEQVLLVKRGIEPRTGFWALPAGYLELAETTEDGARREAWEEAGAELELRHLLAVYNLAHLSQVQILYLAELKHPNVFAGPESLEVGLFSPESVPWDQLAFPSVSLALKHAWQMLRSSEFRPDLRSSEAELRQAGLG
ncbi:MAG: NUDIX hydrolase [Candidatus Sericytochromatia bacterium]